MNTLSKTAKHEPLFDLDLSPIPPYVRPEVNNEYEYFGLRDDFIERITKELWCDEVPEMFLNDKLVYMTIMPLCKNSDMLADASFDVRNDKAIAIIGCGIYGGILSYLSDEMRDDKDVVLTACSNCGMALEDASERLRRDPHVVMTACVADGSAIMYANSSIDLYEQIATIGCLLGDPEVYSNIDNKTLLKTERIVKSFLSNLQSYRHPESE